jgi:drug/metabolite transporter (DMT)-like permease
MSALVLCAALIAPFLYAVTNHIDKILLEKYFKEGGVGTLMIVSSLLSVVVIPVAFLVDPTVLSVGDTEIAVLAFAGFLNLVLLWAYLQAMNSEEPTVVIVFYQLVPLLGLLMGNRLLGETITLTQGVAMILIMTGATVMTIATDENGRFTLHLKTVGYMLIASLCWASQSTLFKMVALEENVIRSLFWENLAMVAFGIVLYCSVRRYRRSFLAAFRKNSAPILWLNVLNEMIYVAGSVMAAFVVMLIPVALNLLMNSFQPIFVLVIGALINRFIPGASTEAIGRRLPQKIIAIALTGVGAYLLGGS